MRTATLLVPLVLAGSAARASNGYPAEIQRQLAACLTPTCTACHVNDRGSAGTATRPFGITMQNAGLRGNNDYATLRTALQVVEANGTDSDGDGAADIAELDLGTNPSDPSSKPSGTSCSIADGGTGGPGRRKDGGRGGPPPPPQDGLQPWTADPVSYGCSSAPELAISALAVLAGALALSRRRSLRSKPLDLPRK